MISKNPDDYRKGVGIVLLNNEKKIFVGKRIDNTAEAWQMPQGGIDGEETPEQAALRELHEEVGTNSAEIIYEIPEWLFYDLPAPLASRLWGGRYKGQMQKWFVMKFIGKDNDININTSVPEFREWKWAEAATIPKLIVDFKRELYLDIFLRCKNVI